MNQISTIRDKGYLSLCYHYIRPSKEKDPVSDIICTRVDEFLQHLQMLGQEFNFLSLANTYEYAYADKTILDKRGMLLTFDDGLSDHYLAAQLLADAGIKATFFIPTCIIEDNLPANPPILNYAFAMYRISGFLEAFRNALENHQLNVDQYNITFERGKDDPWEKIKEIKSAFKYKFHYATARNILIHVYQNLLLKNNPEIMQLMHLTQKQIQEILIMGHSIGSHSHTHVSVGAHDLSGEDFQKELVQPKYILQDTFETPVFALSYPFGSEKDVLSSQDLVKKAGEYKLAFTTAKIVNTKQTPPLELGRYMPRGEDTVERLEKILNEISNS